MPSPSTLAKASLGAVLSASLVASPVIVDEEGWLLRTYNDPIGLATACAGVTGGVVRGKAYSQGECEAMTLKAIVSHALEIRPCLPPIMPVETFAAFISFAYNVGSAKACGSTMFRLAKAGDLRGACDQLPRWNKAGGKVLPGLVKRREAERALCLRGLA